MPAFLSHASTALLVAAFAAPGPVRATASDFEPQSLTLTPRVQVLAQLERFRVQPLGNVTLIVQQDGVVVVDAGGTPQAGRRIVEAVRALGDRPVKAVILTHWHGDHVLGAGEILRAFPRARLIATHATYLAMVEGLAPYADRARLATALEGVQARYRRGAQDPALSAVERDGFEHAAFEVATYAAQFDGAGAVLPTEFVDERLELPDPASPVVVQHVGPGNTPGDLVVWLPAERILVTGDLLVRPVPFAFDVQPRAWAAALRTLAAWNPAVVVPGHGLPGDHRAGMLRLAGWLCEAHARAAGVDGTDTTGTGVDLNDQVDALAGEDPWLRLWAVEYWAIPLMTSALRDLPRPGPTCPAAGPMGAAP